MIAINGSELSAEKLLRLMNALKSGQNREASESTARAVLDELPGEKKAQVTEILKDKQQLEALLKSEQVQALLKKISR